MRLHIKLTKNKEIIPFNYQPRLTGAIHKWIGKANDLHGKISLYSFSWLQNVSVKGKNGINLTENSSFFVSAHSEQVIKQLLKGIINDSSAFWGAYVSDIEIMQDEIFTDQQTFFAASPVFIKRRFDDQEKHITYEHENSGHFLTETLQKKLGVAGLSQENVTVEFDKNYHAPQTKIIRYNEIANRVNVCPVIIKGTSEQIAFAWNVGIGNSTGIGFGALK